MYKPIIYGLLLFGILFSGCEEELEYNLNTAEKRRLVVDGAITNHPFREDTVRLSWTTNYFDKEKIPWINDAQVSIADNRGSSQWLRNVGQGRYITSRDSMDISIGNTYTLSVQHQGETYTASSKMHSIVEIDSIKWYYDYYKLAGDTFYQITYFGPEPPEKGNNYMWHVYMNDRLITDTLREVLFQEDDLINGEYIANVDLYWYTDEELNRHTREVKERRADTILYTYPDTVNMRLEMFSIPDRYINFLYSAMAETAWRSGFFDGPPANVPSNVSNNALGYFYAAAYTDYEFSIIRSERFDKKHRRK